MKVAIDFHSLAREECRAPIEMVYPGDLIFTLKDTQGLPFSMSFTHVEKAQGVIDWVELVETARAHDWWDYQIVEALEEGFTDSGAWPHKRADIMLRIKQWMMATPHPAMAENT